MRAAAVLAREFAQRYRDLVEALLQEGATEEVARREARLAALALYELQRVEAALVPGAVCPLCGH